MPRKTLSEHTKLGLAKPGKLAGDDENAKSADESETPIKTEGAGRRKQNEPRKKRRKNRNAWAYESKRLCRPQKDRTFITNKGFNRIVKEILTERAPSMRISKEAARALHTVATDFATDLFRDTNAVTVHRKGHTVKKQDMRLVRHLRTMVDRQFSVAGKL